METESSPLSTPSETQNTTGSTDFVDDFELISGPSEETTSSPEEPQSVSLAQQQPSYFPSDFDNSPTLECGPEGAQSTMDPHQSFVLIQQEHEALRKELQGQHSLLTSGLKSMKEIHEKKKQEVNELKKCVSELRDELDSCKEENKLLKNQMKCFNDYRDKVDELTAKLCHADDVAKYHEDIIRQFQSDGFVSVQPPMLTDAMLARELTEKENQIKTWQGKVTELESAVLKKSEDHRKAEKDNEELRGLVLVLQEQVTEDRAYLNEVRSSHDDEIKILRDQLRRLEGGFQNSSHSSTDQTMTQGMASSSDQCSNPSPELTEASARKFFTCETCGLKVLGNVLYMRHMENCRPPIDKVD